MSGEIACSRGCFICPNCGDGPASGTNSHSRQCCGSTSCDSRSWNRQTEKWLKAEKQWKQGVAKWLLAETLYREQCDSWLAAEQTYQQDCQVWLLAQADFRATIRSKAVKRVRVQAAPATPQTAKVRAHAR